jgi:polyisoprenoid-binding protein YceI
VVAALAMTLVLPVAGFAAGLDNGTWLDSTTSAARFYQGSAKNPTSVNTGVARVAGTVELDENQPSRSVVDITIYPAGESVPDSGAHTFLKFESKRTVKAANGKLAVTGDLTLSRVEQAVSADPNEAYAGPEYREPVVRIETREVTFEFAGSATEAGGSVASIVGSARIAHEDFKPLTKAIAQTNWAAIVANQTCENGSAGEDYRGVKCTGTEVATVTADNCHAPAAVGEGFGGLVCAPPSGNQTTIALELRFAGNNGGGSGEALSGNGAAQ